MLCIAANWCKGRNTQSLGPGGANLNKDMHAHKFTAAKTPDHQPAWLAETATSYMCQRTAETVLGTHNVAFNPAAM